MTDIKRVALALGSGGARGYAHIGVIDEVKRRGWEIVGVAGTSMGAVIGGLHAAGKLDDYRDWVTTLSRRDVLRLMDPTIGGAGMLRAEKVMGRVRLQTGDVAIEDLPIPFTAVATDLISQREVWFTEGDLVDAMRASIAIPTVFTPVHRDGMVLADGGLLNPIPVAPLSNVRADAIIAVNLGGAAMYQGEDAPEPGGPPLLPKLRLPSLPASLEPKIAALIPRFRRSGSDDDTEHAPDDAESVEEARQAQIAMRTMDVVDRSLTVMQSAVRRFQLASFPPDLLIDIPADASGTLDFHRASELIELGREKAVAAFDAWGAA